MVSSPATKTTPEDSRPGEMDRVDGGLTRWRGAIAAAGWAALASVALTFVQVWIYLQWPPPGTVDGFFALFADSPFLGLLSLDLLFIVNNVLVLLVYLGLFLALRRRYPSAVTIGLLLGSVGIAAYMASNTGFEMLSPPARMRLPTPPVGSPSWAPGRRCSRSSRGLRSTSTTSSATSPYSSSPALYSPFGTVSVGPRVYGA